MFTVFHPEIAQEVLRYPKGIQGFRIQGEPKPFLIVKMPHQYLLTAKINGGFKVYVVPLDVSGVVTIGLMTAFFDDPDNPLTLWTPLANDPASKELVAALLAGELKIHLFDEHNRELLGYSAKAETPLKTKVLLEHSKFHDLSHEVANELSEAAQNWFGTRTSREDAEAISIEFGEPLFPEEMAIMDMRFDRYKFHGSKGFSHMSLVKTEPGQFQEIDIILLLQRIFRQDQIYYAPKRVYDKEEIADIIVITDDICLIIQAKDSPNTEKMLQNSLARKRLKAQKQLKDGITQASGAIGYLDKIQPFRMYIDDHEIELDLGKRQILSLIVVRELFQDDYAEYSKELFDLFGRINLPCIALDYPELHTYTSFCEDSEEFIRAYFEVFDFARANGQFPRLRFGMRDLHRGDGSFKFDRLR
jgi:hypothetical protein